MRLIPVGLTMILATLALASSTLEATSANTLTGTVGPGRACPRVLNLLYPSRTRVPLSVLKTYNADC
jgi:hypothetical protein